MSLLEKQPGIFKTEFSLFLDGISDAIVFTDRVGNVVFMNEAFKREFDKGLDLVQKHIQTIFPDIVFDFTGSGGKGRTIHGKYEDRDVEVIMIRVDIDNNSVGYWVIIKQPQIRQQQITERKYKRKSGLPDKEFFEFLSDAVAVLDEDHRFTYVNKSFAALLGMTKRELLAKDSFSFIKGLENYKRGEWQELKIELINSEANGDYLKAVLYPGNNINRKETFVIIKGTEASGAAQYKIRLLNSKLAYYQEQLEKAVTAEYRFDKVIKREAMNDSANKNQRLKDILEATEKLVLVQTLQKTSGNKVRAAKLLGISRAGLYQKLEKHSLLDE